MNRLSALLALALLLAVPVTALCAAPLSKDEANLQRESTRLDKTASEAHGETAVVKRLARDFDVPPDRVAALRGTGLGYGDITIVLSLARKLPGGITDANVEKVTALRQGQPQPGWGEVAKKLQVKLGVAVSQVKKVNNEAHREMKTEEHAAQQKQQQTEPVRPSAGEKRTFSGEGKDMTRGRAAE